MRGGCARESCRERVRGSWLTWIGERDGREILAVFFEIRAQYFHLYEKEKCGS
jgi:hypothetical protein